MTKTPFTAEQQEGAWVVINSVQTAPSLGCSQGKAVLEVVVVVRKPPNHRVLTLPFNDNDFISFFF